MGNAPETTVNAIIMAAGKGTRLKSDLPKVLHPLFGRSLISRVLDALGGMRVGRVCVIVGHGKERVSAELEALGLPFPYDTVVQEPQLGTGHAVQQVKRHLEHQSLALPGTTVILSGDVPLLRGESLKSLIDTHHAAGNALTLLSAELPNPFGYGRVILEGAQVRCIVEEKDATADEKQVRTINTGIYALDWQKIAPLLDRLTNDNAQGEYYLTDVIALAVAAGLPVGAASLEDAEEILGVNSRADLAQCHDVLNRRTQARLMAEGVTLIHPCSTVIAPEVQLGPDTVVHPGCYLQGTLTSGRDCVIGPHTSTSGQVSLGDRTKVIHSMVRDSVIGEDCVIGPFAQLRDGVEISHHVLIGNFVEVKKTKIDHHTNASHLAYLGDAVLGTDVNIGAGTITANYDPLRDLKQQTTIEDGAKIGSNSVLIAPVVVGERSTVAAGSVITKNTTPWSLAIARQKQSEIVDWVKKVLQSKPAEAAR